MIFTAFADDTIKEGLAVEELVVQVVLVEEKLLVEVGRLSGSHLYSGHLIPAGSSMRIDL